VHKYAVGDVVVWDDRHVLHSTSPIQAREEVRVI
jgi:alpha-ketoglutarate-dependent taurine dioxygenase